MELNKDSLILILAGALVGGGSSTGLSNFLGAPPIDISGVELRLDAIEVQLASEHEHPSIMSELRENEYQTEIYKLQVNIAAMTEAGENNTAKYKVAESQLLKFTSMLTDLKR